MGHGRLPLFSPEFCSRSGRGVGAAPSNRLTADKADASAHSGIHAKWMRISAFRAWKPWYHKKTPQLGEEPGEGKGNRDRAVITGTGLDNWTFLS
jgi:hypothetical protein